MKRVVTPELLDSDCGTPDEIRNSLADLRNINRRFGGIETTRSLIEKVVHKTGYSQFSLLDVAAGSGDVAAAVKTSLAPDVRIQYTLLDSAASHLNGYRPSVIANALALPFHDESFDLVSCSLFMHHLEPSEISTFIEEALRVSRIAVLINDLRRSAIHLALVYAGFLTFRSRLTRHDSVASLRRSYTPEEVAAMLASSTATGIEIYQHFLFRMGVIAWKRSPEQAL